MFLPLQVRLLELCLCDMVLFYYKNFKCICKFFFAVHSGANCIDKQRILTMTPPPEKVFRFHACFFGEGDLGDKPPLQNALEVLSLTGGQPPRLHLAR